MYNTKFIMSDGSEIYPGYLSEQRKLEIRNTNNNRREYMRCGCKPEANLFYRISEDLRVYPEHNNYQHDILCCRYKDPSGQTERQTAYIINDESGEVTAFTSFDPLVFSQTTDDDTETEQHNIVEESENENLEEIVIGKDENAVKQAKKKEPKLTISGLIRSINVDTFTERVLNNQPIDSKDKFSASVFNRMKKVKLARARKHIGELSLEQDGCRFVYLPFAGFTLSEENGYKKCYVRTRAADGKIYNNFIFPDTMYKAAETYMKNYGMEPDNNTMLAGFQYFKRTRSHKRYKVMGRIHMFQISSIGLYCRNMVEVNTFNDLQYITEKNTGIKYWIPPEDDSIGAIISIQGKIKKILVIFRRKKEERVVYDTSAYVPLVVDNNTNITEKLLYDLVE